MSASLISRGRPVRRASLTDDVQVGDDTYQIHVQYESDFGVLQVCKFKDELEILLANNSGDPLSACMQTFSTLKRLLSPILLVVKVETESEDGSKIQVAMRHKEKREKSSSKKRKLNALSE